MKLGKFQITPLAAESLGSRSLCTEVVTPDFHILLDPSAALAKRYNLEPHPLEYVALKKSLNAITISAEKADALSISHYHYDHVRPGLTNYLYNLSTQGERKDLFQDKFVLAKDNRENINPSQRRRGFFLERDVKNVVKEIKWADSQVFEFGNTKITYSHPLPHGEKNTRLGYVLATTIEYSEKRFLFAPDVQGPVDRETLHYILSVTPELAIVGGPPVYLSQFTKSDKENALYSLISLASAIPTLVIDHHILRDSDWLKWIDPVIKASERAGNRILTMAEFAGTRNRTYEADRKQLYQQKPPSDEFMNWTQSVVEYKISCPPPIPELAE
ncbi:MAG: MBL fold metallo-hydrolase [Candidatus Thorarchaeota archaeon]